MPLRELDGRMRDGKARQNILDFRVGHLEEARDADAAVEHRGIGLEYPENFLLHRTVGISAPPQGCDGRA